MQAIPRAGQVILQHYIRRMDIQALYSLLAALGAVVGVYVKMSNEVARLKSRVIQLELNDGETRRQLKEIVESIHKIELTLAQLVARLER